MLRLLRRVISTSHRWGAVWSLGSADANFADAVTR